MLNRVRNINLNSSAKCFDSYDFSTLYTSIPHNSLKVNLQILIDEAFKIRGAKYLCMDRLGSAYWAQSGCAKLNISKGLLIELIEYLVDNIFIKVGNRVYRQCVGIPMGTDCAPLIANLYLFFYEYKYMKSLLKNNFNYAKKFANTVRYIDDLLTLNNSTFSKEISNIYPVELTLKRTTESCTVVSYLDICIHLKNKRFVTTVYDKRDSFDFHIVNFPFLDSNIPTKPAYGIYMYISQLVRIGRICDAYSSFTDRNRRITARLIKQGFKYSALCDAFKTFGRRHKNIFDKYGVCMKQHIHDSIVLPLFVKRTYGKNITQRHTPKPW